MKIFVTGGTGFIGSHLVETLLARGDEVTCLVRSPAKADRVFGETRPSTVEGTLDDLDALRRGCGGVDAVMHLAGLVAARSRDEFMSVNGHATRTLAKIAAEAAPDLQHFVYLSSLSAAGPTRHGAPLDTDAKPQPVSGYGWSKLAGEEAVRASATPWTIVRPPAVYGPRDTEMFKVFQLAKYGWAPAFGDGSQELSLIYGPDLAAALVSCLTGAAIERTFYACHPETCTALSLAERVHAAVSADGGSRRLRVFRIPEVAARAGLWVIGTAARLARRPTLLTSDKANEFFADAWTCSPSALRDATGFTAPTALEAGLVESVRWYREAGWL